MVKLCVICGKGFEAAHPGIKGCSPECKHRLREDYVRSFYATPKQRGRKRAYHQRPEVKARRRTPEYYARQRAWRHTPKARAWALAYYRTDKTRAKQKEYRKQHRVPVIKLCVICGNLFEARGKSKTDSQECSDQYRRAFMRCYHQLPQVKRRKRASDRIRKTTPQYRAYKRAYDKAWRQTPKAKAGNYARNQKAGHRAHQRTYRFICRQNPNVLKRDRAYKRAWTRSHRLIPTSVRRFFQLINTANQITKLNNETSNTANYS